MISKQIENRTKNIRGRNLRVDNEIKKRKLFEKIVHGDGERGNRGRKTHTPGSFPGTAVGSLAGPKTKNGHVVIFLATDTLGGSLFWSPSQIGMGFLRANFVNLISYQNPSAYVR